MSASNYVHLDVAEILAETDKAFLLKLDDDDNTEFWCPKSQIESPADYEQGDKNATVSVTKWIAEKNDIEVDE